MPDDLAKRISEISNRKPISPEDELADALEDMARYIAMIEPNPVDWAGWVLFPSLYVSQALTRYIVAQKDTSQATTVNCHDIGFGIFLRIGILWPGH